MRVIAMQGDTLDALCHRHLGATAGMVEKTLALNYGISLLGPLLPMGTEVELPDVPASPTGAATRPLVQLWD
ncbi:tail protein X [Stenotrophomonas maltophilia]|uniref:tail protein X n=1 Tax=Stenotrophomonas maltophilia TaxID=40324 RepID=UPI0013DAA62F|nr:tail protein X [Stenotrophomonas maltophilia]